GLSRVSVPCSTRRPVRRSHSASEPSHHSTRSGLVSSAIPRTHSISSVWPVGAWSRPGTWLDTGNSFSCSQDVCMMNKTRCFCYLVWTNHVRYWPFHAPFVADITYVLVCDVTRSTPRPARDQAG